jgi:hypothetical protein
MNTVWVLTIAYALGSGTATEKYGPYETVDQCKKAATEMIVFGDTGWRSPVPMSCVPEPRTDK